MGENVLSIIHEEEEGDLSISLFREWWVASTAALAEEVGTSRALTYLVPGFKHHGRAGYQIFAKSMGWEEDDLDTLARFECFAKPMISGYPARVELHEDGIIWSVQACCTMGRCKEACLSYCYHGGMGMTEAFGHDMEYQLHESISQGDDRCLGSIQRRGKGLPSGGLVRSYALESSVLTKMDRGFWSRAAMGEAWTMVTRIAIDCLGEQRARAVLDPPMYRSGRALGTQAVNEVGREEAGDRLEEMVAHIQSCFAMDAKCPGASSSGEISSCPFSGGPAEMCHQFEAFMDGVCSAIDPGRRFTYDRMMTKGDTRCHWTMARRETAEDGATAHRAEEDPIKALGLRLAKGEISLEAFEQVLSSLRKSGIIE